MLLFKNHENELLEFQLDDECNFLMCLFITDFKNPIFFQIEKSIKKKVNILTFSILQKKKKINNKSD